MQKMSSATAGITDHHISTAIFFNTHQRTHAVIQFCIYHTKQKH